MRYALGKRPARAGAVPNRFETFFSATDLPVPPMVFGRPDLVSSWGMLANDEHSDCVWASYAHQTMYWRAFAGAAAPPFTDAAVLSDYSAQTGYVVGRPATDQGTDMGAASLYWQKIGISDATGQRHRIDASVSLRVGDLTELALAVYLGLTVSLGVMLPSAAQDEFDACSPWSSLGPTEGGHAVPVVGRNGRGNFLVVTWGRLQAATPAWIQAVMDEGQMHASAEQLRAIAMTNPRGLDEAGLLAAAGRM